MQNTIDGLDEMEDIDFEVKDGGHPFLRELGEAVGWAALLAGFALAMIYLTPPQRSAEADLCEAQMKEVSKCPN